MINPEDHLGLVHSMAYKLHKGFAYRYSEEDLVQIASVGLVKATKDFDESRGYKFSTIAAKYITTEIVNCIRKDSWNLVSARERFKKDRTPVSLNVEIKQDATNGKRTDFIDTLEFNEKGFNSAEINLVLNNLPQHLSRTIKLKYYYGYKLEEIGKIEGITQQAVSVRIQKALKILREELTA